MISGPSAASLSNSAVVSPTASALVAGQYAISRRVQTSFLSLENLLSQASVDVDARGQLSIPGLAALSGQVRKFREVAPFVWREVNGKNRLAAKVVGGRVVMVSEDEVSFAMTLLPPSSGQDSRWLLPLLLGSLAVLTLMTVTWAGAVALRRYYGVPQRLERRTLRRHCWVRAACAAALVLMTSWLVTIIEVPSRSHFAAIVVDPWVMTLHVLSIVVFPAAAGLAVWNSIVERRRLAVLWGLCLSVSCLTLLWVAMSFHLIGFSLRY